MGGGGKGSDPKMKVVDYYMSMHIGVCHGPVDAVEAVFYGEKLFWEGEVSGPGVINVDNPNLFGGVKKEGGVRGQIYVLPGSGAQTMPHSAAWRMGRRSDNCPAYRGMTSLFFLNNGGWDGTF